MNYYSTENLALVIAVVSIILTIITIYQTKKHNRLTVRPLPKLIVKNYEQEVAVILINAGTGPLIRDEFEIEKNGNIEKHLVDLLPPELPWITYSRYEKNVLPSNDNEVLIRLSGDLNDDSHRKNILVLRQALANVKLKMHYKDIYGKQYYYEYAFIEPFVLY